MLSNHVVSNSRIGLRKTAVLFTVAGMLVCPAAGEIYKAGQSCVSDSDCVEPWEICEFESQSGNQDYGAEKRLFEQEGVC